MSGDAAGMTGQAVPSAPLRPMAILRRRWLTMLATFVAATMVAALTALLLPATYVSTGTILIEQQEVPLEMVRSTISSFADQRIQIISQRVMTSDNLLRIIQQYDLYQDARRRKGRERILQMMRDDLRFSNIKADVIDPRQGRPVEATIAFSLSFSSSSPEIAARVASEIASLYLKENLESRRELTAEAAGFLEEEARKMGARVEELGNQIATFKERNLHNLPEQGQLNLQLIERADSERRDVDTQLRALEQQLVFLDAQLVQTTRTSQIFTSTGERVMSPGDRLKVLRSQHAQLAAIYAPDHPDVLRVAREIAGLVADGADAASSNDLARQLEDARTQLAAATQRYEPEHPDRQRLERLVPGLEAALRDAPPAGPLQERPDNPAYIQLQAQREAALAQQRSLQRKREDLDARLDALARRLESSPGVERDYAAMLRDLDSTQLKYREIRQKQMEAELAQNLEVDRKGERFTLIEPPVPSEEPASPNRPLVLAVGMLFAAIAAFGIALLMETLDHSVRDRRDLTALLSVPPLAIIPWIDTAEARRQRRRWGRIAAAGAGACFVAGVALTHLLYRPLDVLWAVALRRLGI